MVFSVAEVQFTTVVSATCHSSAVGCGICTRAADRTVGGGVSLCNCRDPCHGALTAVAEVAGARRHVLVAPLPTVLTPYPLTPPTASVVPSTRAHPLGRPTLGAVRLAAGQSRRGGGGAPRRSGSGGGGCRLFPSALSFSPTLFLARARTGLLPLTAAGGARSPPSPRCYPWGRFSPRHPHPRGLRRPGEPPRSAGGHRCCRRRCGR